MDQPFEDLHSVAEYSKKFYDPVLWTPYLELLCERHNLNPVYPIRTGIPGTFPTFIVADRWVIKLFGPLFDGAATFEVELWVSQLLSRTVQTIPLDIPIKPASLIYSGQLFDESGAWDWPYLIFGYLPGISFGEAFDRINIESKIKTAYELGVWVSWFHHVDISIPIGDPPRQLANFTEFIKEQNRGCSERHKKWGTLPKSLISQIRTFLITYENPILIRSDHLIHADLTGDHLLGEVRNQDWISHGLIDFGDARPGNLYYELGALHLSMFRGDKKLLKSFIKGFGKYKPISHPIVSPKQFARQALLMGLLHQFNIFQDLDKIIPVINNIDSLEQLADHLFLI